MGNCLIQLNDLHSAYKRYKESLEIDSEQVIIRQIVEGLESVDGFHKKKKTSGKLLSSTSKKLEKILLKEYYRIQIVAFSDFEIDVERKLRWGDYWVKKELGQEFKKLGHTICDKNPDIVLHLFGVPVDNLPEAPYKIIWIHSHPDLISPEILEQYDKVYCLSPTYLDKIKKWGFKAELLVGGTSKKPIKIDPKYDMVFVGNTKGHFGRKIIKDLGNIKHELKVWGEGWKKILAPKQYGGLYYKNEELGELYAASKIVLNDHHEDMRREGFLNIRILDAYASGGFVISDDINGIESIFGDTLVRYKNPVHLRELVDYYILHPQKRKENIEKGQYIARKFTFVKMAEKILSDYDFKLKSFVEHYRRLPASV
jgi:glycosyltransferase involved in cell wall biosynthesis